MRARYMDPKLGSGGECKRRKGHRNHRSSRAHEQLEPLEIALDNVRRSCQKAFQMRPCFVRTMLPVSMNAQFLPAPVCSYSTFNQTVAAQEPFHQRLGKSPTSKKPDRNWCCISSILSISQQMPWCPAIWLSKRSAYRSDINSSGTCILLRRCR